MPITVNIDGTAHQVEPSDLDLPEDYALVTPDNVPEGYYTKEAMESKIQDRLSSALQNKEQELLGNEKFQRKVLTQRGIVLDDDGNPKGLKPEVDVDEIRESTAKQVSEDYEEKLSDLQKELEARNEAVIESAIMEAASGNFREDWTKSFDNGKPLVVKQFKDRMGVDENGEPYVKDESGEKMYKGDGVMRPKDYLLDEKRFGELMKDKRQRSSDFGKGGETKRPGTYTQEDIRAMSDEEYEKHRDDILQNPDNVK